MIDMFLGSLMVMFLDTETIISSNQWKALLMDAGIIASVNAIAKKKFPQFPEKFLMLDRKNSITQSKIMMCQINSGEL
jgi:hypothetical protein